MARLTKDVKEEIQPKIEEIFDEFEALLKKHDLKEFSLLEFKIVQNEAHELNCPCGIEKIILPSGKVVRRCKQCPPV